MRRTIRETFVAARVLLATALPFILLAAILLWGAYVLLKPAPPRRVVLATGSDQGAYAAFGKRYAEELKRYGVEVVLRPTNGSRENLRLLRDPKEDVEVAFVQGGASETLRRNEDETDDGLVSLGSMFYEPVWLYYRTEVAKKISKDGTLRDIAQLRGLRVNTGTRGSGVPGMMNRLLAANLMEHDDIKRSSLDTTNAAVALLNGEIDVLALVS
ncbi:MAG: TAXI family TRAP transporter solute-binding subunit, partial [Burkholderiales bacterium]